MASPANPPIRYAVVGFGALGGYYGGLLAKAGREVHFLARSDYEYVRLNGLRVDSVRGDFALPELSVYSRAADMPKCDVVVITLKSTDNAALQQILPHLHRPGSITLLVQNGLGQEELLPGCAQEGTIAAGLGFICATKRGPGHVVHHDYGALRLAVYEERGTPPPAPRISMQELAQDMEAAGLEIEMESDFLEARWKKLVWNIPFNGLSVTLGANTQQLLENQDARARTEALMLEVISAARKQGCAIGDDYAAQMIAGTEKMRPYWPSMFHDFNAGRPMEIEAMYEIPIERARRVGAEMPLTRALTQELRRLAQSPSTKRI